MVTREQLKQILDKWHNPDEYIPFTAVEGITCTARSEGQFCCLDRDEFVEWLRSELSGLEQ